MTNIYIQNLDLLTVGIAVAAIIIMGLVVFLSDPQKPVNRVFLLLAFSGSLWSIFNYSILQIHNPEIILWLIRIATFFAVWFTFFIFSLFYFFPTDIAAIKPAYKFVFIPLAVITAIINLTPLVFSQIGAFSADGKVARVTNGPGIILFGVTEFVLLIVGVLLFISKIKSSSPQQKKQIKLILFGLFITSSLLIVFNFIFPAFLDNPKYTYLGAVFLFPFVVFTYYAIAKHHLFNTKIIATEVLTFVLAIVTLFEVVIATDFAVLLFRSSTFVLILLVGMLLIKSVRKEVEQREQLQILTEKLEQANEQLEILDQARAEFITMANHQLRTPPATIKWYLSAILAGDFGALTPDVKTALTKTNLTNNSLINLIDDMLNVSRIERGKMEFAFVQADIVELAQLTTDQLVPQAQMKNLKLVFSKPKKPIPPVTMDKEKIRQVINNMIDNAIKYSKQGQVKVEIDKTAKDLVVRISDTGKGMSPEELKNIFQKYGRGKDAQNYTSGLGLGMYVAKIVIEQHKGKLWAESAGAGRGSTFAFTIPLKFQLKSSSTVLDLTKSRMAMK